MKRRFLFVMILGIFSQVVFAQSASLFDKKSDFVHKYFNMKWKLPTGFQLVSTDEIFLMMGQSMDGKKEMTGALPGAWQRVVMKRVVYFILLFLRCFIW